MSDPISTHAEKAAEWMRKLEMMPTFSYERNSAMDNTVQKAIQRGLTAALAEKEQECTEKDKRIAALETTLSTLTKHIKGIQDSRNANALNFRKANVRIAELESQLTAEISARAEDQERAAKLVEALQWCADWMNDNRYNVAACIPEDALAAFTAQETI